MYPEMESRGKPIVRELRTSRSQKKTYRTPASLRGNVLAGPPLQLNGLLSVPSAVHSYAIVSSQTWIITQETPGYECVYVSRLPISAKRTHRQQHNSSEDFVVHFRRSDLG